MLWIVEGYSKRQLLSQSKKSRSTLDRILQYFLGHPPLFENDLSPYQYLLFDGTFLKRRIGVVATMEGEEHRILHGAYAVRESSPKEMRNYFSSLLGRGLSPKSVTVDGNPQVIQALKEVWLEIIIQRCLVHIERQGLMWTRQYPKRTDAKYLRKLFLKIPFIKNQEDKERFLSEVQAWEEHYGSSLARAPARGWVESDLKRARSMLLKALPDMFHFLDDPNIPSSTNGLEGYFSRLKARYQSHRGLSPSKRSSYFQWYFFLVSR